MKPARYPVNSLLKVHSVNRNTQDQVSRATLRHLCHARILHRVKEDTRETARQIIEALADAGIVSRQREWEAVPAGGGLSQRAYLVRRSGQTPEWTIRLAMPGRAWRLTRQHELLEALKGTCACVPDSARLLQTNTLPEGVLFLQRYVTGAAIALPAVSNEARAALAACLACLHTQSRVNYTIWPDLQPTTGTRADLFRERLEAVAHHATFTSGLGDERHPRVQELYGRLSSVRLPDDQGWNDTGFSQLHGDLTLGNMIWTGESVTLIDWEYARDGDPAEELAYLFTEQPVSEMMIAAFHEEYVAAGGDPGATSRAAWYAPLVALDSALWWGDYHVNLGNDPSQAGEVLDFIAIAEASLRGVTEEFG